MKLCVDEWTVILSYLDFIREVLPLVPFLYEEEFQAAVSPTEIDFGQGYTVASFNHAVDLLEDLNELICLQNVKQLHLNELEHCYLFGTTIMSVENCNLVRIVKILPSLEVLYLRSSFIYCGKGALTSYRSYIMEVLKHVCSTYKSLKVCDISGCIYLSDRLREYIDIHENVTVIALHEVISSFEGDASQLEVKMAALRDEHNIISSDAKTLRLLLQKTGEPRFIKLFCKPSTVFNFVFYHGDYSSFTLETILAILDTVGHNTCNPLDLSTVFHHIVAKLPNSSRADTIDILNLMKINDPKAKDIYGRTAFHYLIRNIHFYLWNTGTRSLMIDKFINEYGISMDADNGNETPLDLMLLTLSNMYQTFSYSKTTFDLEEYTTKFLNHGCQISKHTFHCLDKLMAVKESPQVASIATVIIQKLNSLGLLDNSVIFEISSYYLLQVLLSINESIDLSQMRDGETIIHKTIRCFDTSLLRIPQIRPIINTRDNRGRTPLQIASARFYPIRLERLISAGADINMDFITDDGTFVSILHYLLLIKPNIPMARFYLEKGHRLTNLNSNEDTIWHVIARMYTSEVERRAPRKKLGSRRRRKKPHQGIPEYALKTTCISLRRFILKLPGVLPPYYTRNTQNQFPIDLFPDFDNFTSFTQKDRHSFLLNASGRANIW
jgi:ankyrin repeat protein